MRRRGAGTLDDDPHHLRSTPRNGGHPGSAAPAATAGPPRAKASPQRGAGVDPSAVSSSEWKTVMEEMTLQKEEMEELRQQFRQEVEKLRQQHREGRRSWSFNPPFFVVSDNLNFQRIQLIKSLSIG